MKHLLSLFLFVAALAFLLPTAGDAQQAPPAPVIEPAAPVVEPMVLKTRFIPGKTYRFKSVTAILMKLQDRPGQASIIKLEQHAKLKVNKRPSGEPGVHLTASTEAIKFRLEAGGRILLFDSTDEKSGATDIGKHFQNSLSRWTQIELTPDGKLKSRTDGGGGGAATPLPQLPEVGPDQLQQMIATLIHRFPPNAIAPGKEWIQKGETTFGQFGNMEFEITNRYEGDLLHDNATCAVIQFDGTLSGDVKVDTKTAQKSLEFERNKMKGQYFFDKKLGIARLSEQIALLQISNPDLPKTTIEQQLQVTLKSVEETAP